MVYKFKIGSRLYIRINQEAPSKLIVFTKPKDGATDLGEQDRLKDIILKAS